MKTENEKPKLEMFNRESGPATCLNRSGNRFATEDANRAVVPFRAQMGVDGPDAQKLDPDMKEAMELVVKQFYEGYRTSVLNAYLHGADDALEFVSSRWDEGESESKNDEEEEVEREEWE